MSYRGDFALGATIDIKFTTRRFSTGVPFTLAGSPAVVAYVDNGTTEITAGITLSVDFDGRTGLNNVRVVASSGNGFGSGTSVDLVLSSGTVDSVSVVGEVVGSFTLERASSFGRLGAPAGASVSADIAAVKAQTASIQTDTDDIQTRLPAALVSGRIDSHVGSVADAVLTAAKFAAGAFDAVWTVASRTLTAFSTALAVSVWDVLASAVATASSIGLQIKTNLDTTVSSRSSHSAADVWAVGTRTLTSFGTLVADVATAVWAAGTRTLTSFGTLVADIWAGVTQAFYAGFFTTDSGETYASSVAGSVVKETADNAGGSALTVQDIVDGVWNESLTAHQASGSTGAALADSSGDTSPTVQEIVDGVWDESLTAHQGAGSTGAALADASGDTSDVNVIQIGGLTEPVTKLVRSTRTIVLGTVDAGATTTVIPTSALAPAAAIIGQFNGRVVIFDETTATATLRGCAATIESSAADGTLTLLTAEQLPAAPASGDTFVIV